MARPGALKGTRAHIMNLLRQSSLTANELADRLGLTHNAVRGHLAALQQEGLIREGGMQRGISRPAVMYEVVPEAEAIFSHAYIPFVAQLVRVLRERVPQEELDGIMHLVGKRLAGGVAAAQRRPFAAGGSRVGAAGGVGVAEPGGAAERGLRDPGARLPAGGGRAWPTGGVPGDGEPAGRADRGAGARVL